MAVFVRTSSTGIDVEACVIAALRPAVPAGTVVATEVPRSTAGTLAFPDRMVRVGRTGGNRMSVAHDRATILVECWAARSPAARELAAACRDAMFGLDNARVVVPAGPGVETAAWLSFRAEGSGLVNHPDVTNGRSRYQFVHELLVRAAHQ